MTGWLAVLVNRTCNFLRKLINYLYKWFQARKLTVFVTGICCVLVHNYYTSSVVSWLLNGPPPSLNSLRELLGSPLDVILEDVGYARSWLNVSVLNIVSNSILLMLVTLKIYISVAQSYKNEWTDFVEMGMETFGTWIFRRNRTLSGWNRERQVVLYKSHFEKHFLSNFEKVLLL